MLVLAFKTSGLTIGDLQHIAERALAHPAAPCAKLCVREIDAWKKMVALHDAASQIVRFAVRWLAINGVNRALWRLFHRLTDACKYFR